MSVKIAVAPQSSTKAQRLVQAVEEGNGVLVDPSQAEALVWLSHTDVDGLEEILRSNPAIRWVQLPWAGVEHFAQRGMFESDAIFTCAKGAYGQQVGEHAVVLTQAVLRQLTRQARAREWCEIQPRSLFDQRVTILGAGGIAATVVHLLTPYRCDVTVLRRSAEPMAGANRTLSVSDLHSVLPSTDVLILALSLTPATARIISAAELALLPEGAVLVNVARGGHVDQEALVDALSSGHLFGAGLDVTDPEPLPSDHPLWSFDQVTITSHCADGDDFVAEQLGLRVTENLRRFSSGQELIGVVNPSEGY